MEQLRDVARSEPLPYNRGQGKTISVRRGKGTSKEPPLCCVSPPPLLQVVARGLAQVLVFEDDVRFESNFRGRLEQLMEELEAEKLQWDLM